MYLRPRGWALPTSELSGAGSALAPNLLRSGVFSTQAAADVSYGYFSARERVCVRVWLLECDQSTTFVQLYALHQQQARHKGSVPASFVYHACTRLSARD